MLFDSRIRVGVIKIYCLVGLWLSTRIYITFCCHYHSPLYVTRRYVWHKWGRGAKDGRLRTMETKFPRRWSKILN